jgi:hypothetical protein
MSTDIIRSIVNAYFKWENAQTSFKQQIALREFKALMKMAKENLKEEELPSGGVTAPTKGEGG